MQNFTRHSRMKTRMMTCPHGLKLEFSMFVITLEVVFLSRALQLA